MPRFRKKPLVIEAEQFHPGSRPLPFAFRCACNLGPDGWYVVTAHGHETRIVDGDWIIPEPNGKGFYPCKPDIFAATYDQVLHLVMVCGVDCHPGDSVCNNYCNQAPQNGQNEDP